LRPEDIAIVMYWSAIIATFIALIIVAFTVISQNPRKEKSLVYTIEKCYSCGYINEREYREEDYVGKKIGTCPKCGAPLYIDAIYEVKLQLKEHRLSLSQRRK